MPCRAFLFCETRVSAFPHSKFNVAYDRLLKLDVKVPLLEHFRSPLGCVESLEGLCGVHLRKTCS
jgi:hypothetical protein